MKPWPNLYGNLLYVRGQDLFDTQYVKERVKKTVTIILGIFKYIYMLGLKQTVYAYIRVGLYSINVGIDKYMLKDKWNGNKPHNSGI